MGNKIAQYEVVGKPVICGHCGNDRFAVRQAQLNTAMASFLDMDFLNKSAWVLTCVDCNRISWFGQEPAIAYR